MRKALFALVIASSLVAHAAVADEEPKPAPAPESDTLDPLRDRFRSGMENYKAGKYGEAILVWSDIYRELGPEKGYRLAFNLGRAYDQILNEQRALEFYEAYLAEVEARRRAGETLESIVEKQATEADERLIEPRAKHGRLRIADRGVPVRIDAALPREGGYVAYVAPGKHVVTFRPGTSDESQVGVQVDAGQRVDVAPPPIRPPAPTVVVAPTRYEMRAVRPYTKAVLYVGAGVTALSFLAPTIFYVRAGSKLDDVRALPADQNRRGDYTSAQTGAYASWTIPAVLGAATIALTSYWFLGSTFFVRPIQTALTF